MASDSERQADLTAAFRLLLDEQREKIVAEVVARCREGERPGEMRPRLLTVKMAAEYLGRSERALRNLIAEGRLPTKRVEGRIMFDIKTLDRFIDSC